MQCPKCRATARDGAKFCEKCGTALPRCCPACGNAISVEAQFCGECGASLTNASSASTSARSVAAVPTPNRTPRAASTAERRQLTIMFCDMVGSSALSTRLDPEEQRDVVGSFQAACAREIKRFDGLVAQYLGDGVLAYFGYPVSHEDDAERAVRAGLAILDAVKNVATAPGVTPDTRIGIASGLVVVGDLVREGVLQENAAIGETTNLAARLQALAEPATLVIAAETHRIVGGLFEYRDLGSHHLKGFTLPVHVRQVLGASGIENRFEARQREQTAPILGRDEELEWLWRRWEQTRRGQGRVALLSGEPGIGKSRLTRALQERVVTELHVQITCHCSPYHQDSALHPIVGHFVRAASIKTGDTAERRLEKLERLVAQSHGKVEDDVPVLAALLAIPTTTRHALPSMSPQQMRERTLKTLTSYIAHLAGRQPVLMLVEDLHWIDPTSLELLSRLVEMAPGMRLLLLATARPEFVPPWPNHAHVLTLPLNRLDRMHVDALVAGLTGGKALPDQLLDQIAAHTDGVPLFIEELTKTVLESDLLRDAGDRWVLDGPLPPLAIPSTLQASLVARLDRLASVKDVAQTAAVIGREFSHSLLAAVAGIGEAELRRALGQLVDSGLIFRRGEPPDATYQFKHALVQDAAYGSLVRSSLQQRHARVAEVLARERARATDGAGAGNANALLDAPPGIIAIHYLAAHLPELALPFQKEAAERAASWGQHEVALQHYSAALAHLERIDDRSERCVDMLTGQARSLHFLGRREEAIELLDRYEPSILSFGRDTQEAQFFMTRASIHSFLGSRSQAQRDCERALAAGQRAKDPLLEGRAYHQLGVELHFAGDERGSLTCYGRALDLLRAGGEQNAADLGHTLLMASFAHRSLGQLAAAREAGAQGAAMAQRAGDLPLQALAAMVQARNEMVVGEYASARALLEQAVRTAPSPFDEAILRLTLAVTYRHLEAREVALEALKDALQKARRYRSVQIQVWAMSELADALISFGQIKEAGPLLDEAFNLANRIEARLYLAEVRHLRGRVSLAVGDLASAEASLVEALIAFERAGAVYDVARTAIDLFRLYEGRGERATAVGYLEAARTIFREIGVPNHGRTVEALAAEASISLQT